MYIIGSPQIRWPSQIFDQHPIPAASREFLISVGLPECFEWPTYEFGVYDSDAPDLVIGEIGDDPIVVESASGEVWFCQDSPAADRFFNSSVELLSRFLFAVSEFQNAPDD